MELIEHWWNGYRDVFERKDIYLRRGPHGMWEVELCLRGSSKYVEFGTEELARRVMGNLRAHHEPNGEWRELTYLHRELSAQVIR